MKYYYLIEGKLMWSYEKMPTKETHAFYDVCFDEWKNSLQPCEISESELMKIYTHLSIVVTDVCLRDYIKNPIEVTDIVEEKPSTSSLKYFILFRQPKQVEEIEVEFAEWTYVNWWTYNVMKGFWYNIGKQKTDKTYTTKQLYEIFKNQK